MATNQSQFIEVSLFYFDCQFFTSYLYIYIYRYVRTAKFNIILSEPLVIIIKMRANTRSL
jgi:hypothetical protein